MDFLKIDQDVIQEEEKDVVGGFKAKESDIYPITIKLVYFDKSTGGANNINVVGEINGDKFTETAYLTNKEGKNFYIDKKTGQKKLMPGIVQYNAFAQLFTGSGLAEQAVEEKHVKVWDSEKREEVPKPRMTIPALEGLEGFVALRKVISTKMEKDDQGKYTIPTAETREENEVEKWFNSDKFTQAEKKAEVSEPTFFQEWLDTYQGNTRDKTVKTAVKAGGLGGTQKSSAKKLDLD